MSAELGDLEWESQQRRTFFIQVRQAQKHAGEPFFRRRSQQLRHVIPVALDAGQADRPPGNLTPYYSFCVAFRASYLLDSTYELAVNATAVDTRRG